MGGRGRVTEYRLEDLAQESGISARNIRAYRERGLLDPPRRVGRSALYDDYHLSQLNTISQLLRKGYNSAHIAEFFASMRQGTDLADILGLQQAVLGEANAEPQSTNPAAVAIDADGEEARKLAAYGLAAIEGGEVVMIDAVAADILARAPDPGLCVRALLRFVESTEGSVEQLAAAFAASLEEFYRERVGADYLPRPHEVDEIRQTLQDYRLLGEKVMLTRFDQAARRHMVASASEYTTGIMISGAWEPGRPD
jgi:DNA-binding transcriptional MerR regulator